MGSKCGKKAPGPGQCGYGPARKKKTQKPKLKKKGRVKKADKPDIVSELQGLLAAKDKEIERLQAIAANHNEVVPQDTGSRFVLRQTVKRQAADIEQLKGIVDKLNCGYDYNAKPLRQKGRVMISHENEHECELRCDCCKKTTYANINGMFSENWIKCDTSSGVKHVCDACTQDIIKRYI